MNKAKVCAGAVCILALAGGWVYYSNGQKQRDVDPPVISADAESFSASIGADDKELISGVTATDEKDGDVSDSILIDNIKKKEDSDNDFLITYVAFDKSSNMTSLTRTLHYSDYQQVHFSITPALRFPENQEIDLLSCITANDCIDGDVTPFVTFDGDKELLEGEPKKGIYECTLNVTNSVGFTTSLPISVEIYEDSYDERNKRPELVLNQYVTYLKKGQDFNANTYLDHVVEDGEKKIEDTTSGDSSEEQNQISKDVIPLSSIEITSKVNTEKKGIYTVNYRYTSEETGYDCNANLIVVVE